MLVAAWPSFAVVLMLELKIRRSPRVKYSPKLGCGPDTPSSKSNAVELESEHKCHSALVDPAMVALLCRILP